MGDAGEEIQHLAVQFAGVGLAGDGEALVISHLLGDFFVQLAALLVVPFKQFQEAGLGAGGAFAAQEFCLGELVLHILQIHQQVLDPQGGPFAHGGGLSRLEVGESQGGQVLIGLGKVGQHPDDTHNLVANELEGFGHDDDVRIVPHVAGGGAPVDDARSLGALLAIGVHMAHHIVADHLFPLLGHFVVDVVGVLLQLCNLLICNGQPQLLLRLSQSNPKLPPGAELHVRGKKVFHFLVRVAGGQGGFVHVSRHVCDQTFLF